MLDLKSQNQNAKLKTNIRYRAYNFSLTVIDLIKRLPNQRIYWVVTDQLLRSSTSIAANLIEAKSSSSKKDFIKYYDIALKSANETKYWLCLLRDSKLATNSMIKDLLQELNEVSNMLGASLLTLKGKK